MGLDIQVFVKWKDQTVFAGEDIECTITFKNVAESNSSSRHAEQPSHQRMQSRAAVTSSNSLSSSPTKPALNRSRRSYSVSPAEKPLRSITTPLSSPLFGSHSFPPTSAPATPRHGVTMNHKHKRSVSILSIGSEGRGDVTPLPKYLYSRAMSANGHGRSASLQAPTRGGDHYGGAHIRAGRNPTRDSPQGLPMNAPHRNFTANSDFPKVNCPGRPSSAAIGSPGASRTTSRRPPLPPIDFKFPPELSPAEEQSSQMPPISPSVDSNDEITAPTTRTRPYSRGTPPQPSPLSALQLTRAMSGSSMSGNNSNNGEAYPVSDNSSETVQSEYTNYSANAGRILPVRHASNCFNDGASGTVSCGQALLMGYAQVSASFTVDASLVNQSAFEEVKRKGVVGAQGGSTGASSGRRPASGDKARRRAGLWDVLRWDAIEESISGLLSNNELSGLRDMRGVSSSRSIPLLSTPQSLLFVDLHLMPGEERSFLFSFTLPSGLPASHKGKAIKISYSLIIGTQRPSARNEPQRVNRINIPFRVFNGVDSDGNIQDHDLMSPYVLLRDEARVQKIGTASRPVSKQKSISVPAWTSAFEFLSYVDGILDQQTQRGALDPLADPSRERHVSDAAPTHLLSCRDAIDLAILRSNRTSRMMRSPNRFEIARGGRRVGVVILNRPAHRLGERITAAIDFANAVLPCYAVRATLETSEKVSPTLAVRSSASIHRATRRIYASFLENTLYSTRVVFCPAIPISATPTVLTRSINLEWELRIEFITPCSQDGTGTEPFGSGLLETAIADDRGSIMSALERLGCESFEVVIPVTVYGETVKEPTQEEAVGYSI